MSCICFLLFLLNMFVITVPNDFIHDVNNYIFIDFVLNDKSITFE